MSTQVDPELQAMADVANEIDTAPLFQKPYYQDDAVTIYHGDCRELLPHLRANVGLVLTDPPFSEETHKGARTARNYGFSQGDTDHPLITFDPLSYEDICAALAATATRRWLIAFMDWRHVARLAESPLPDHRFVRFGIWNKTNGAPQFTGDRPAQGFEAIAILHREDEKLCWNGGGSRAVWTYAKEPHNEHPTQKPEPLIRELVQLFSNPGDLLVDPFMGSGTTLRAAKDLGRRAIGIEIEEKYCEIAAKRMAQEVLPLSEGSA